MPTRRSVICRLAAISGSVAAVRDPQLWAGGAGEGRAAAEPAVGAGDWPWWRGPTWNGVAESGQQVPLRWSDDSGLAWQVKIPGRSHGSPIVVGQQVLIEIADPQRNVQSLLCVCSSKQKMKATANPIHRQLHDHNRTKKQQSPPESAV